MKAETLLDIFEPPDSMFGHSAALVAMTGTQDFLEDVVQRFTGLRPRQRAELGIVSVYLMLDGHASASRQEVFPPGRIPGLHEFQPRAVASGSLLHGKIALLAFARSRTGVPAHLRLAVLTANFTYASARRQLELAWVADLSLDNVAAADDCADFAAAGVFVRMLFERRFHRDEQELPSKDRKLTQRLDVLLAKATSLAVAGRKSRFIHSLDQPLYDQIRERFSSAISKPRNLLLCGSGVYEEPSAKAGKPAVIGKLEELGLFTANVRRVALVEPDAAGAVATWARNGKTEGWKVVLPFDRLGQKRRLHAKFVYAGYLRDGRLSNGRLYLGSGNLSRRGLLTHGKMVDGNVETGVVLAVDESLDAEATEGRLFWSRRGEAIGDDAWAVGQVGDAPEAQPILAAPPILSARIESAPPRMRLLWRVDCPAELRVSISLDGGEWFEVQRGHDITVQENKSPTRVTVRGGIGRHWDIPVVDTAGRVGWQPPRFETFTDALAALLDFPIRPVAAIDDGEAEEDDGGRNAGQRPSVEVGEKTYALHAAAELIEEVAALQASLPEQMLDEWFDHLDRMLQASFPQTLVQTWRTHRLDIFEHLGKPELRPPRLTRQQLARYFEVLDCAARAWGLR